MDDQALDDALLDARLEKARRDSSAKKSSLLDETGVGFVDDVIGKAKAIPGLITGTPIAEQIPIAGPLIRKGTNYATAAVTAPFSDKSIGTLYDENEARSAAREKQEYEDNPSALAAKSTLGSFALPNIPSVVGKVIPEAASFLGKFGRGAAVIGENAVQNAASTYVDSRLRDLEPDQATKQAKMAAYLSGVFGAAPHVVSAVGKGYSRFAAQIHPDTLKDYRANRDTINNMNPAEKYEEFAGAANDMKQRGEIIEGQASRNIETDKQRGFAEAQARKQSALAQADREEQEGLYRSNELKSNVEKSRISDEEQASQLHRNVAEDLSSHQKAARKAVNAAAEEAMKVAEDSGAMIKIAPFKSALTKRLNEFNVGNTRLGGGVEVLEKLQATLNSIGQKEIPAIEFRRLIKSFDDEIGAIHGATAKAGYITPAERNLSGVRHGFAEKMRGLDEDGNELVPGYAAAQAKTAGKTQALKGLQEEFSYEPDSIYRELNGIHEPGRIGRKATLEAFEKEFGGDFTPRLDKAKAIRETDYSPQLSEAEELRKRDYKSPYKMDLDIAEAMKRKDYAAPYEGEFERAKGIRDLGSGITDEDSARKFMEQFGRKPEDWIGKRKKMEAIAREQGLPEDYYTKTARMLAVKRGMEGGQMQGSRMVQAGKATGEGLAEIADARPGPLRMLGAWAGLASDVLGKTVVKKVVDVMDSPRGQKLIRGMKEAAARGPRALSVWHEIQMKNDPEYKRLMDEEGE